MQTKQYIIPSVLAILITFAFLCFPEVAENQYAYSQSTNWTGNATGSGVDLINIHPSPSNVKAGSNFELLATVVNNSPGTIMLPAGRCDSPLTAFFMRNVVIRQDKFQGCTATTSPFELNQGKQVTVAGPVPGTIYQAIKAGKTPATATVYYVTENRQPGNVTKPFVFTIG
ncbi:MAG: hypothetical protein WBP64_05820 [Nitrososphaeraceae archaeon]